MLKCFAVVDKCPYVVYNVVHIHRVAGRDLLEKRLLI